MDFTLADLIVILKILVYARLSLSWEINVPRSQLTRRAGVRCLGTIRMGGCNLQYRGGKQLRERH